MTDLPAVAAADLAAALAEKINEQIAAARTEQAAVRVAVRVDPDTAPSLLAWLKSNDRMETGRVYWRDRACKLEAAALGTADVIRSESNPLVSVATVRERLQHLPDSMRYFGGFRFAETSSTADSDWRALPAAQFLLPRFEFIRYHKTLVFACNLLPQDLSQATLDEIMAQVDRIDFTSSSAPPVTPNLLARVDVPDRETWDDMLIKADQELQVGDLQKVVLARRTQLTFDQPISGWEMLEQLERVSEGCFLFGMALDHNTVFFGSTPERLYHREGRRLQTEAIAGTRARAADADEDAQRIAELKASAKDSLEHSLVIDGIVEGLESLSVSHKQDRSVSVITLSRLHHLACRILGKLDDAVSDDDLLRALHPTPAVGGLPRAEAMALITQLESFDRGWYAGPIGWLGKDAAEFAVAIRSALAHEGQLVLYAGAGIVPGSDPDGEWQEIESKIARYITLLAK
jgi:menaquinone-specific isochorismate synthase